ncbi:MAG: RNA polymerase sigma factor [Bacteroidales bacterium]|nr:RNA polymerase sigma factor [Bacteroidales bacterium]
MMNNFDEILAGCKKNNSLAYVQMYRLFCDDIFNSCYRILGNTEEAEEITQDSFLKAFETIKSFSGTRQAMNTYIRRIAINKSIDEYRKAKRISFISTEVFEDVADDDEELETGIVDIDTIVNGIKQLPTGFRLVLTLHLLEELSFDEIASQLHITASTVRSQYVRGKEKLKNDLIHFNTNKNEN